ncbi:C3H1-type Zn-finger protein [Plasmopara halstedii]|uniref:C3H1-type Zn-finger protein n=1 Tax=Plasmopara halstedii TaxID=4781 RepID=A0A0P1AUD5_PLAHL|nr:C3H1-type Zn-finger protein [Plasmopara halstedii]CEG45956.1 C3H1-type Zn-finger protein [Plasmopara halstedii]|eukprot:XP_024582325.1 C3H1-type Zn-finger protein [Plasmopara halstedii]
MEEAKLRAKIQAMKNLLEAKQQKTLFKPPHSKHLEFNSQNQQGHVARGSANKVWRREDALNREKKSASMNKAWKRPVKISANYSKSMQLQVLRLEDGDYAKAKGGYSLVRAEAKKPTVTNPFIAVVSATPTLASDAKKSVHIGGVKYIASNEGKILKRCFTETRIESIARKRGLLSRNGTHGAVRAALIRAKATVQRARNKRFHTNHSLELRTEYCSFYNRFGYCKNKNECKYIHDSRRVSMCRKFLKNECKDSRCLLSHQHDENKVPDCRMFLRGACTRDNCKYRHVKVSATADICKAFTNGFCFEGAACPLRHELRIKSPMLFASRQNTDSKMTSASGLSSKASALVVGDNPKIHDADLLIRPNIRFASNSQLNKKFLCHNMIF